MGKIRVLSLGNEKKETKRPKGSISVQDYIEQLAPNTYTFSKGYVENALQDIEKIDPDIIWLHHEGSSDYSKLISSIKKENPDVVIFAMITGIVDDEQEIISKYSELGVYKCYFIPPLMFDELIHDMYVSMNLE